MQWVAVEIEDTWQAYSRRPGEHLDRAARELKTNPKAAALDIREANSYLQIEQLRHPNDLLKAAVRELDALADDVRRRGCYAAWDEFSGRADSTDLPLTTTTD